MMRKKDAFTLVEMLVVIVVVVGLVMFVSCAGPNNWLGNRNSEEIICKSNKFCIPSKHHIGKRMKGSSGNIGTSFIE